MTVLVFSICHNDGKACMIDLGEGKVQMREASSDDLDRANAIAEAIIRVRGLIVANGSAICRGRVRIAGGWRYDLTKSKANLAWGQAIWIRVSTM